MAKVKERYTKSLKDLGYEYLEELERIKICIAKTKGRLSVVKGEEHRKATRDLEILRQMYRECEDTAYHLIHYYNRKRG
jgi:phosphate uptake regulator